MAPKSRTTRDRDLTQARRKAWRRLADAHSAEFDLLYQEACREAGIEPARPYWKDDR